MRVTWRSIAPIFADVVVSPWNLLVGGLLIQHLSFFHALLSIIGGYSILSFIFILYGGLGFKYRKQSSQLLSEVFGSRVVKYVIPLILALGQIGWAAINIDLGGRSLGVLLSMPWFIGVGIYTVLLIVIARLNLFHMGIVKFFITLSALSLMAFLFIEKVLHSDVSSFFSYHPLVGNSLFWGLSIIVASLISFSTITPDFFQSVKTKNDVVLSTIVGLFPGMLVALLGCFLFYNMKSLDLVTLLTVSMFSVFPNLFNAVINTDGSTAIYTPALKLTSILPINFTAGVIIAGISSFLLALLHASLYISQWLTILSLLFPTFIGVCFSAILFRKLTNKNYYHREVFASFIFSTIISLIAASFFPPVITSLLLPILFFIFSLGYVNLSVL